MTDSSTIHLAVTFDPVVISLAVGTFGLIVAAWWLLLILRSGRKGRMERDVEERLGLISPEESGPSHVLRLWRDGKEAMLAVPSSRQRRSLSQRMEHLRRESGLTVPATTLVLGIVGSSLLAFVVTFVFSKHVLAAVSGAVGVVLVVRAYLNRRVTRRKVMFETQFLSALDLAVRSLRAGHPLTGACRLISEEIPAPVGLVFAGICQQQEMGADLATAIKDAAAQSGNTDMKLFATSVAIQMRSGGNLAEMMEGLAAVIRERMRLSRRVRVLTAQTQFSKRVLAALPLILFAILNIVNPRYVEPLYSTSTGQMLLGAAALGVMGGMYMMNRMAVLRY